MAVIHKCDQVECRLFTLLPFYYFILANRWQKTCGISWWKTVEVIDKCILPVY